MKIKLHEAGSHTSANNKQLWLINWRVQWLQMAMVSQNLSPMKFYFCKNLQMAYPWKCVPWKFVFVWEWDYSSLGIGLVMYLMLHCTSLFPNSAELYSSSDTHPPLSLWGSRLETALLVPSQLCGGKAILVDFIVVVVVVAVAAAAVVVIVVVVVITGELFVILLFFLLLVQSACFTNTRWRTAAGSCSSPPQLTDSK